MWRNSSKTVATSVEVQVVILLMNNELLVFLWNAPNHYDRVGLRLGCSILLLDILVYEVRLNELLRLVVELAIRWSLLPHHRGVTDLMAMAGNIHWQLLLACRPQVLLL